MKLLIITQVVDRQDPVLGFMHSWLEALAPQYDSVSVICLRAGEYALPPNVSVRSLGKETRQSRLQYLCNLFRYLWQLRHEYDAVFVHMNQEYILLAGWWWRLTGKKIVMWRNHHQGNILTRIAVLYSHVVLCTSKYSYTAQFTKTTLMPVGIDTELFTLPAANQPRPFDVLFLARFAPVKKPHLLVAALAQLHQEGRTLSVSIYGDPLPHDQHYYDQVQQQIRDAGLADQIRLYPGIPNSETPTVYQQHRLCVNLSSSGMYDKTIFEAMACGTIAMSCNKNLEGMVPATLLFKEDSQEDLANKIRYWCEHWSEAAELGVQLRQLVVEQHSLKCLITQLKKYL